MIIPIDNKPVDVNDQERQYIEALVSAFGLNIFQNTFEVIEDEQSPQYGWITIVKPPLNRTLPLGVVFALFNIMLNQRMRKFDEALMRVGSQNAGTK